MRGQGQAAPRVFGASRAFLVRAQDIGEADRRLVFFTESSGVLAAAAKSARKSRKRFGGALQKFLLLDIAWTERGSGMPVLASASLVESFWDIVESWDKVRHADYILELAAGLFPQPGPKPKAFALLLRLLSALSSGELPESVARKAEGSFLSLGGWGPALAACRQCGREAGANPARKGVERPSFRFVVSEGGLRCWRCAPPGGSGALLSPGAIRTWRAIQSASPAALGRLRIQDSILEELQGIIPEYLEWCLGRQFRSIAREIPSRKP
ncbi:MAG: DNA repair protein RecO [Deltaproteobacteria bacterium]